MTTIQSSPDISGVERAQSFPSGTVTFLFTDIEGSTRLWEQMPDEMRSAVKQHRAILREAVLTHNGHEFEIYGDSFQAAFSLASDGLYAALAAQRLLRDAQWGPTGPLKVRMGLHTGTAVPDPSGEAPYVLSHTLNRSARVMSAGYGGQILLSQEATDLVERELPAGVRLRDLGDHHLKGLTRTEHLYQVVVSDLPDDFPPLSSGITRPNNLPAQLTTFIGREKEISEVCQHIQKNRLVTLTGAGGTGKTRLALRVAHEILEGFSDGIWLVELAPVTDPEFVSQTVASTLGLQKTTDTSYQEMLESFLSNKHLLLILDNCEHLLETCAFLATKLLQKCSKLCLLATSREALNIAGETAYYVPSLVTRDPSGGNGIEALAQLESVRLFAERAAAVRPGFSLSGDSLRSVAHICERLDGIPLAIELAAARVIVLSVEQISTRLDDRFRLLTGGSRVALPRHRTLRASIDWSFNLLPEEQRLLLQRLSVFTGGWTLAAAEAICAGEGLEAWEILDALTALVEKSLVIANHLPNEETRYHSLETIRQYAQEQLNASGETAVIHNLHLAYFLSVAEAYEPLMRTPQIFELLEQLDLELDNLRGALSWALGKNTPGGAEYAMRILSSLFYYWLVRVLIYEADGWMQRACKILPDDDPQSACLKGWSLLILALQKVQYSYFIRETIDHLDKSIGLLMQACDLPTNRLRLALAQATRMAAINQFLFYHPPEPHIQIGTALKDGDESFAIAEKFREAEDPETLWFVAWIYLLHARTEFTGKGQDKIFPLIKTAQSMSKLLGDQVIELLILVTLVWLYLPADPEQCMLCAKQGIILTRRMGDKGSGSTVNFYGTLGLASYLKNLYFDMEDYFLTVETIFRNSTVANNVWGEIWNVRMRGVAAINQKDAVKAQQLLEKALNLAMNNADTYGVLSALLHFAGLAILFGQNEEAANLLGFVEIQFEGFFKDMDPLPDRYEFEKHSNHLRNTLSERDFSAFYTAGRSMKTDQAIQLSKKLTDRN